MILAPPRRCFGQGGQKSSPDLAQTAKPVLPCGGTKLTRSCFVFPREARVRPPVVRLPVADALRQDKSFRPRLRLFVSIFCAPSLIQSADPPAHFHERMWKLTSRPGAMNLFRGRRRRLCFGSARREDSPRYALDCAPKACRPFA